MAVSKIALTKEDIVLVKNRIKANSTIRLLGSGFSLIVLLIVYLCVGCDTSNHTFYFFRGAIIVINAFLLLSWLRDINLYNDLNEKQKYVGTVKVKKKEYHYDNENNSEIHQVNFDEWRVGNVCFKEKFWNDIEEGDEFYVEQAANSSLILKLEKDNVDFKIGLIR
ncbi:hypothetical protein HNP37_003068 [Flavobacterium nitrogenifigens]|uniref:Uncharacterized protein n=2 Tax=Flavobacterium TaxID=237 RepID=A0A7W7IZ61_9FLAO|nr:MULTISPECIES: hypothetical protein [Flavobacterium]MBB4802993.1 hypothetical protein [Flavobacterium nitrogenifigens]MBB6387951.1 hypothetical protein [Flavobacterium notoginsengisoli]